MRVLLLATALLVTPTLSQAEPPDLSGRGWSGYWRSDKNGHHGPLHATFRRVSETCYRVRFHGRFWKIVPFIYSVNLRVTGIQGDTVYLSGNTPVGPVIGTFRYDGFATPTHFEARFTSKNDCGQFVLSRGCPCR